MLVNIIADLASLVLLTGNTLQKHGNTETQNSYGYSKVTKAIQKLRKK